MKLCLINTPYLEVYGKINVGHNSSFPLGLGYIASVANQRGHSVLMLDPEAEGITSETAMARLKAFKPDLVGLSCVTPNFGNACEWAKMIKRTTNCLVMVGGVHVTVLPVKSLEDCPEIDFVIMGEGEYIVSMICDAMEKGQLNLSNIPSICYRKGDGAAINSRAPLIKDLDDIPYPARDLVDMSWYRLQPQFERGKLHATVSSSRGCPASCTFCGNVVTGRKFRPRAPRHFVDELKMLSQKFGIRHFHIVDDNFAADPERVIRICREILRRKLKISWFIFGRVEHLNNESLLRLMKEAGCVYVLFGIESGNQQMLDNIKKKQTLSQIEETCRLCRRVGLNYCNSFIIGCPGETEDTVKDTVDFAIKLKSVLAAFNIMIPFPGTALFNQYYRNKVQNIINWKNWCSVGDDLPLEYIHTELSRKELLRLVAKAHIRYYTQPGQLLRLLRFGCRPRVLVSYLRGGVGLLRASLNWLTKK